MFDSIVVIPKNKKLSVIIMSNETENIYFCELCERTWKFNKNDDMYIVFIEKCHDSFGYEKRICKNCKKLLNDADEIIKWKNIAREYSEAAEMWRKKFHNEHIFTQSCCRRSISGQFLSLLRKNKKITERDIKNSVNKCKIDNKNVHEKFEKLQNVCYEFIMKIENDLKSFEQNIDKNG